MSIQRFKDGQPAPGPVQEQMNRSTFRSVHTYNEDFLERNCARVSEAARQPESEESRVGGPFPCEPSRNLAAS